MLGNGRCSRTPLRIPQNRGWKKWRLSFRSFPRMRESTKSGGSPRTGTRTSYTLRRARSVTRVQQLRKFVVMPAPIGMAPGTRGQGGSMLRVVNAQMLSLVDAGTIPTVVASFYRDDERLWKIARPQVEATRLRWRTYSMTSSASASSLSGTSRPSALAVLILMTSSKRVGRTTGTSRGSLPFRICAVCTPSW
jgi:hypothetical protein